jgi:uncharacterized membrane protein
LASTSPNLAAAAPASRWTAKQTLWLVLGLLGISVLFSTEYPILHETAGPYHDYFLKMQTVRFLLIPHALCGIIATFIGPLQFSSRFRRKHLPLHRILGRVYVIAIFIAAPLAILISRHDVLMPATITQASVWMLCTLMAFLTARNRHIAQHRQWMVRSYAVTFTFVSLRILNFLPAYLNMTDVHFIVTIIVVTFASAFVIPDIAFHWRELTTRRA